MVVVPVAAYWADEPNLVREWEIDYDLLVSFDRSLECKNQAATCGLTCGLCLPFLPCRLDNIRDLDRAQHVAITRDGIRYSVGKHKTGCRCDCEDAGKVTKTVPFDKITDCDVKEPGGSSGPICCLQKNVIYTVVVDTASSGGDNHELIIRGLRDPKGFKEMVWQMKRVSCLAGGCEGARARGPTRRSSEEARGPTSRASLRRASEREDRRGEPSGIWQTDPRASTCLVRAGVRGLDRGRRPLGRGSRADDGGYVAQSRRRRGGRAAASPEPDP
jgi:hypothetical protein